MKNKILVLRITHTLGIIFSIVAIIYVLGKLLGQDFSLINIGFINLIFSVGILIGLFIIGLEL